MLSAFAETHALALRDFVVSGVEIAHQFRIEEIERLTGDSGGLLRVDVWDRLKSHIAAAESQFQRQVARDARSRSMRTALPRSDVEAARAKRDERVSAHASRSARAVDWRWSSDCLWRPPRCKGFSRRALGLRWTSSDARSA